MELEEIMTIEEAIEHAEEVAQEKRYDYQECLAVHDMEEAMDCRKCGEEHEQLAAWLKELLKYKSQSEIVHCKDCKKRNFAGYCTVHQKNVHGLTAEFWQPEDDYFCADGERKTDGNNT